MNEYIEIVRFRLNAGISEEDILAAELHMAAHLSSNYAGYLGRQLLKSEDGAWTVLLRMASKEAMQALLTALKEDRSDAVRNYVRCVNLKEARIEFYLAVR
ncbi:MAG: hypothetical protein K1X75_13785 [Leptospirales bacterium]|nr:hypothetical protein [Leptospirales bacterium]